MQVYNNLSVENLAPKALAIGQFDGVHIAHKALISQCVNYAHLHNCVPAVVSFINHKDNELITSIAQKQALLAELGILVLYLIDFEQYHNLSGKQFIEQLAGINAKYITCGYNFRFGKKRSCGVDDFQNYCKASQLDSFVLPCIEHNGTAVNSTTIRQCIKSGEIGMANALLGRSFCITGEVVHGRAVGRTIDFPTANQVLPSNQVLPKFGVYASKTIIDGTAHDSITNFGIRPMFLTSPLAETHIMDFNGDLYGKTISVELVEYIRGELKFGDLNQLKAAIECDLKTAKALRKNH